MIMLIGTGPVSGCSDVGPGAPAAPRPGSTAQAINPVTAPPGERLDPEPSLKPCRDPDGRIRLGCLPAGTVVPMDKADGPGSEAGPAVASPGL